MPRLPSRCYHPAVRLPLALIALALATAPGAGLAGEGHPRPDEPIYHVDARVDGPVLAASALTIAVPELMASRIIRESCPCDPASVNAFDRGAIGNHSDAADVVSTVTVGLAVAAPPVLDVWAGTRGPALASDLVVFGEVVLVNGALVQIAKYTVQRPLPRTYAGDPGLIHSPAGYRSFYSGHTSTAVAALTAAAYTARRRYGEQVWPWLVIAGVGASVAVERVAAGQHFPSDVLVGAAAGAAVGLAVPWLHARRPSLTVLPMRGGLAVAGRF
jgi:membrane-associated phospholipid phosphatase